MSFLSRRVAGAGIRRYSTKPAAERSSNLGLYLGVAGIVGIGGWAYSQYTTAAAARIPLTSALDKDNFQDFKLKRIETYNHNTAKLVFELPPNTASLLPVAGCVLIKSASTAEDASQPPLLDSKGKPFIRPYTPISPSEKKEEIEFLIKKYDTGKVTPYLHNLKVGQSVAIKGPIPKIPYKENEFEQVGMIAGGSGITPMYQVLQHALSLPSDKTKFTLLFGNIAEEDILLRETFDTWAKQYPDRFKVVYLLDKPSEGWKGATGYVTPELLKKHIAGSDLGEKVKVLVCGPPGQVAALSGPKEGMKQGELKGILKELGYTSEQVFKF